MKRLVPLLLVLPALALGIFLWANGDLLRAEAEQVLMQELGARLDADMELEHAEWQLGPQPRLHLYGLTARRADAPPLHTDKLSISLSWLDLMASQPRAVKLHIGEISLTPKQLTDLIDRFSGGSRSLPPDIEVKALTLRWTETAHSPPFALDLHWDAGGRMRHLLVKDGNAAMLRLSPADVNRFSVHLDARYWHLPYPGLPVRFERLYARGFLSAEELQLVQFNGELFEGQVNGQLRLDWRSDWRLRGQTQVRNMQAAPLLSLFGTPAVSGRITSDLRYQLRGPAFSQLPRHRRLEGDFRILDGVLHRADLQEASRKRESTGGETRFQLFEGRLAAEDEHWRFTRLKLHSDALEAEGDIEVRDRQLAGEVEAGLKNTASLLSVPLSVSGDLDEPRIGLEKKAMLGAAAGTAIMGPGVGTAVGLKLSTLVSKVRKALDKPPAKEEKVAQGDELFDFPGL